MSCSWCQELPPFRVLYRQWWCWALPSPLPLSVSSTAAVAARTGRCCRCRWENCCRHYWCWALLLLLLLGHRCRCWALLPLPLGTAAGNCRRRHWHWALLPLPLGTAAVTTGAGRCCCCRWENATAAGGAGHFCHCRWELPLGKTAAGKQPPSLLVRGTAAAVAAAAVRYWCH